MILSAALGSVAVAFGQEEGTNPPSTANLSAKLTKPVVVGMKNPSNGTLPVVDNDGKPLFSTHPMPNSYRGDHCVSIPNAYMSDNCVPMPNVYNSGPTVIMRHLPDSTAQRLLKEYERKGKENDRTEQP